MVQWENPNITDRHAFGDQNKGLILSYQMLGV